MLYVTTRSRKEQYPALRTLGQNRAPDGGLYVPFRLPEYGAAAVAVLKEQPFGACVAEVLNRLFSLRMNGADVDYTLGRAPVKLVSMNHRIHVAEMWHNPQWRFDWAVSTLTRKMQSQSQLPVGVTEWAQIAVRIGILFAVFGPSVPLFAAAAKTARHGICSTGGSCVQMKRRSAMTSAMLGRCPGGWNG